MTYRSHTCQMATAVATKGMMTTARTMAFCTRSALGTRLRQPVEIGNWALDSGSARLRRRVLPHQRAAAAAEWPVKLALVALHRRRKPGGETACSGSCVY